MFGCIQDLVELAVCCWLLLLLFVLLFVVVSEVGGEMADNKVVAVVDDKMGSSLRVVSDDGW